MARRPHEIKVRLSDGEMKLIEARVKATGCRTIADYLRRSATGELPQPTNRDAEIAEALGQLCFAVNRLDAKSQSACRQLSRNVQELTTAIYKWAGF
ncbi:hypothetical protein [Thioclava sp. F28-4]|uniref:plasmid mobilization protein n=1 Tax=Thioclava sp. F28-4 TaxID=1915315 RepID=UPI000997CF97|nr:hypothetical protein [Thioclava sp. F28-4]OOY03532.1 hypothetical protein BMI87_17490 [Thioclava sp. F28-4]